MKNPVAPIVCAVQFISPPSEIVAVERHNKKQAKIEIHPNEFNEVSGTPKI
jgi:hypothetical protein